MKLRFYSSGILAKAMEENTPASFRYGVLAIAAMLMVVHYTIDEFAYHPEHNVFTAWVYWSGAWKYAALPFVNWLVWRVVSGGRLKTLRPILMMSIVLCAISALALCIPSMLRSIEALHLHKFTLSVEKWHWSTFRFYCGYSTLTVLVIGNLVVLLRWRREATRMSPSQPVLQKTTSRANTFLKAVAIMSATAACLITAIHLVLPRIPANADIVDITRTFVVQPHLRKDFDYLMQRAFSPGQSLRPLLTHVELADLQRRQFYQNLDDSTFQAYVLSPEIDRLPLAEVNWRRTLWENFYPRVRHETDAMAAAQIVVRFLRERVGIDPSYDYRVGVETIWTEQMTDETGFERIYVAALRSVGIASRLNDQGKAELLEGDTWQAAPRVLVSTFEEKQFPVPKGGLVNWRH